MTDPAPTRIQARRARGRAKVRKRVKWTAITLAGTLLLLAGGAYGLYLYFNGRIKTTQRDAGSDGIPQAQADESGRKPLNILLIGSDTRVGQGNEGYGDDGHEGLADTTILMHVAADRSNATLVSIPRDTMVSVPKCTVGSKSWPSVQTLAFNETLTRGGPPCTVSTVDRLLGVQVDHYVMIDFKGVKAMTSAVDGVPICLSAPINDPVLPNHGGGTDLFLPAGPHTLQGEDALKFLRARHAFGDGSDLARIEAQKGFLMALARKLKNSASLTNVDGMFRIANAATGNLTVDDGLGSIPRLVALGNELKKVPEKRMSFTTLPNEPWPQAPQRRVQQAQPAASQLWAAVRADVPLTKGETPAAPSPSPTAPQPPAVDPATVRVNVRNGSGGKGVAQAAGDRLKAAGFGVGTVGNTVDGRTAAASSVTYPAGGSRDAAVAVATAVGLTQDAVQQGQTAGGAIELVLGKDYAAKGSTAPKSSPSPSASPSPPAADVLKQQTADQVVCAPKKG